MHMLNAPRTLGQQPVVVHMCLELEMHKHAGVWSQWDASDVCICSPAAPHSTAFAPRQALGCGPTGQRLVFDNNLQVSCRCQQSLCLTMSCRGALRLRR